MSAGAASTGSLARVGVGREGGRSASSVGRAIPRLRGHVRAEPIAWQLPDRAGPLVAVAGLCGGAGASTLAYLLAASAARDAHASDHRAPVLACELATGTAGLAAYAGARSTHSLTGIAAAIADGCAPRTGLFAELTGALRLIAGGAECSRAVDAAVLARVIDDARQAHCLTVLDCGTPTGSDAGGAMATALTLATHRLWVLPASAAGLRRCTDALAAIAPGSAREVVVARRDGSQRRPPVRALARLADDRGAPLVLMPEVPDVGGEPLDASLSVAEVALQALAAGLRR